MHAYVHYKKSSIKFYCIQYLEKKLFKHTGTELFKTTTKVTEELNNKKTNWVFQHGSRGSHDWTALHSGPSLRERKSAKLMKLIIITQRKYLDFHRQERHSWIYLL